jgi:hypothetical protein
MHAPSTVHDAINAMDEAISTIHCLAELGPAIDGHPEFFPHAIELFSLIGQQAAHLEKLSASLARCVLPRPHAMEGTP